MFLATNRAGDNIRAEGSQQNGAQESASEVMAEDFGTKYYAASELEIVTASRQKYIFLKVLFKVWLYCLTSRVPVCWDARAHVSLLPDWQKGI